MLVAAVQLTSTADRAANLARTRALVEEAVARGARLVALPENFSYLDREGRKVEHAESLDGSPAVALMRELSAEHGIVLVGGSIPLAVGDGRVTNTCLVYDAGARIARYDKIHLFDVAVDDANTFVESKHVAPGDAVVTADAAGLRLGLSICYDLRFPELYRALAQQGADVLMVPSAFTRETGRDHWLPLLRARAIENLAYVVAPAQWGQHNDRRASYGRAAIIDPWGGVLAQAPDAEGIILADVDPARVAAMRRRIPCLEHVRPDVYPAAEPR